MSNAIVALLLFVVILGGLALFYGKMANLSFWKFAGKFPEETLKYVSNDPAWFLVQGSEAPPGAGFIGPFLLAVPSLGRTITLYALEDQIEASQKRFLEIHQELMPRHNFPYPSLLALLYPVAAILSSGKTLAPSMLILGYGFVNLAYLLGAATLYPGHFRILGLDDRIPTLIAAIFFGMVGFFLSNSR